MDSGVYPAERAGRRGRAGRAVAVAIVAAAVIALLAELAVIPAMTRLRIGDGRVASGALEGARAGDRVLFGSYEQDGDAGNGAEEIEWRVLAVEDGRALLISECGLDARAFNEDLSKGNAWETSDLREWLASDFAEGAFSDAERARIDGEPFCLSAEEAEEYFESDKDRMCQMTAYARAQGAYTHSGNDEKDLWSCLLDWRTTHYLACPWWLSSPAINGEHAAQVRLEGYVDAYGGRDVDVGGNAVRPALWVSR